MATTLHRSERIAIPADRPLRVVIVSDTHSEPHPKSHSRIARAEPDVILHAGDIGALAVLDGLAAIAPLIAVRGNIDTRAAGVPDSVDIALTRDGEARLTILLVHAAIYVAAYGPTLRGDVARLARAHHAGLVVCGHSHVPYLGRDTRAKGITLFNPGSIGPPRPPLPITFGVMEVADAVSIRHVSCETGERWLP